MAKPWSGTSDHTNRPPKKRLIHPNGAFALAVATPMCIGAHESIEAGEALVEEELNWKWLR